MKKTISSALLTAALCVQADQPNLIVIMCDDLGYADVGFNGCKDISTPNIDRIAQGGVRCTSGYATYSVCGPSRAGFMTGRYEQRFGFERNPQYQPGDPNMGLPKDERTIAETLKPVGYTSGVIGKWHLGAHPGNHPLNRGFDFFYGHLGGGHRYFPEELTLQDSYAAKNEEESYKTWILRNHEPVPPEKYLTDAFSDAAVEFVTENQKQPFFLFLSYNAPHNPLQATEKYLSRFPNIENEKRKTYAAMISAVDDGVGRVLDTLEDRNLSKKTIVFFLSDNGGPESKNASDNGALRGGKGDAWEGGFRVPYAVMWTGTVPDGTVYDQPVSSLDVLATIADLSGAPEDSSRPLDGTNLIPYLTGKNTGAPHEAIYLRKFDGGQYTVRSGDYKMLIPWQGAAAQLYNLEKDIGEEQNIAAQHPETLQELETLRRKWDSQLVEPRFLGLIHTDAWQKKLKRQDAAKQKSKTESKSKWDWFAALDKNKDGNVTENEWVDWSMHEARRRGRSTTEKQQKQYFSNRDLNGDGVIPREEFEAGMEKK
ncbi:sulfatase-like hydrolase/transferase [Tichowtungia aerotolerans]|uniref:Sulfatase-like hydrolase/transferase n=1 Tax=Tichowtungia aerotolerans TaxID=2697043 RepID=A0A6P1M698_9BACT|nr:sulfatase-like hydrolase/transferase [Tichowtungia aerotolerans]QHI70329.1 sulfatase-like hydrolase/transferase [Tichowtungia aerotolerans]